MQRIIGTIGCASAFLTYHNRCTNEDFNKNITIKTLTQALVPASGYGYYICAKNGKFRYIVATEAIQLALMTKYPLDPDKLDANKCPVMRYITKSFPH